MAIYILKYFYFFILPTFFAASGVRLLIGKRSLPQILLGLYFIAFFIRGVAAFQLEEASNTYYIHFHKVQSPLHYLFAPLVYLFFVFALKPYRKFKWYDLIHFLPFLLHTLELLPFFFGPIENKFKDLELAKLAGSMTNYPSISGLLPIPFHITLKGVLSLMYLFLEIFLMIRYVGKKKSLFYLNNQYLIKWLWLMLFFKILSSVFITLQVKGYFNVHDASIFMPSDVIIFLDVLVSFIIFLFYPKLLNGAIFESLNNHNYYAKEYPSSPNNTKENLSANNSILNKNDRIAQSINIYMEVDAPYLHENFSIKVLAQKLNISERNMSKIIHETFDQSFPDFVATWRLNYIKKMIVNDSNFSALSIEKIAENSGFGSRQALYKVVQRLHKMTPNQFFQIK